MQTTPDTRHPTRGRRAAALPSRMRPHRVRKTLGAFTLIEMLIVISIISVLLGLLYGALERAQKFSRRTITFSELKGIEAAFKQYHAHYHAWPSNGLVNASSRLTSGQDEGFLIDASIARALQGSRETSSEVWKMNPEAVPFIEFSRFSPLSRNPVNPFKPQRNVATDTTRSYKVLFDTNGDRQIEIPGSDTDATASPSTNIVASVAVWTIIPSTRTSDNSAGTAEEGEEIRFGSWDSFSVK